MSHRNADTRGAADLLRRHGFGILHEDSLGVILIALNHYADSMAEDADHIKDVGDIENRVEGELWGILQAKRKKAA